MTPSKSVVHSTKINLLFFLAVFLGGLVVTGVVYTQGKFHIDRDVLMNVREKYGWAAYKRLVSWEELLQGDGDETNIVKLQKVNAFFNKNIVFTNDIDLYGVKDYWATPIESLSRGAGDCEDYAIAKYFTLIAMGVAEEKLRIAYVKALQLHVSHMVMIYYSDPEADPLILDNLVDFIKPASERGDLLPIYTFNGTGLWLAHGRGQGKLVGSSSRLPAWNDLLRKMAEDRI